MMPILIVDDSREDAALASRTIVQCRILNPLRVLLSGDACLDYFKKSAAFRDGSLPCLVLLDLAMKPTSGLEVLRQLHGAPEADRSIFIMLSGIADYNTVREGYQNGAATFFIKPLQAEEMIRSLDAIRGLSSRNTPEGHVLCPAASETIPLSAR